MLHTSTTYAVMHAVAGWLDGWMTGWLAGCPSHSCIVSKRVNLFSYLFTIW